MDVVKTRFEFVIKYRNLKHGRNYVIRKMTYADMNAPSSVHDLWCYGNRQEAEEAITLLNVA